MEPVPRVVALTTGRPHPDEVAAIVAAVRRHEKARAVPTERAGSGRSRWAQTGRLAALRPRHLRRSARDR